MEEPKPNGSIVTEENIEPENVSVIAEGTEDVAIRENFTKVMEELKLNGSIVTEENIEPEIVSVIAEGADEVAIGKNGKKFRLLSPANTYAAKKTVAQGMMDIALITANANQLRYVLEFAERNTIFYINTVLIVISLLLQVAVGVCLIFKGKFDMAGDSKHHHANRLNNYVVMGVFLVTILNVFIATFSINGKTE